MGDLLPSLHGHYPASSLLRSSAPLAGASVLSASWVLHLGLFPYHHRPGSQVPYESPDKSHAACTPDPAWPVSRYLPCPSQDTEEALVLASSKVSFDASSADRLHSSLPSLLDVIELSRLLTITFTTAALDRSSLGQFEASSYKAAPKDLPSSLVQHDASRLLDTTTHC